MKGRSLGLDMPPTPWGRNHCLSEAILERCFRCGFHAGDNFRLVEAIPEVCDSTWWPRHFPSHMPLAVLQLIASLLAAWLACHMQDKKMFISVTDKPILLIMFILVWILAGRQ